MWRGPPAEAGWKERMTAVGGWVTITARGAGHAARASLLRSREGWRYCEIP